MGRGVGGGVGRRVGIEPGEGDGVERVNVIFK